MQSSEKESKSPDPYKEFCDSLAPALRARQRYRYEEPRFRLKDEAKLFEDAKSYFSKVGSLSHPKIDRTSDIYDHSFVVGEAHSHILPKKLLIDHMKELKAAGFEILFLEHFFYNDHQKLLDDYFSTGIMDRKLEDYCKDKNWGFGRPHTGLEHQEYNELWEKYNFLTLIYAAREAGIRVVGIDINVTYMIEPDLYGRHPLSRFVAMPYIAANIIKRELELHKGCKWFSLVGNTHVNKIEDKDILGLADLTSARSVMISDSRDKSQTIKLGYSSTIKHSALAEGSPIDLSIDLSGDIYISGNPSQAIPGFSLSDGRKAKLDTIKNMLQPKSEDEEKLSYPFVPIVVKLINEALQKPEINEADYKKIIQQIHEHLTKITESKEELFERKRNPTESALCQKVLALIVTDLSMQPIKSKIEPTLRDTP